MAGPDQRGDLTRNADGRAADELPGSCDADQETADHQDRDRFHVPGVTRIYANPDPFDQLEDEDHGQSDQEQRVPDDGPPHQVQTDQGQQRRGDEQEPGGGDRYRRRPDFVAGYQREQRDRERVGERGKGRQGSDAVDLGPGFLPAQPFRGDRDGHEQQADQGPGHAGAGREEVSDVHRNHLAILPAPIRARRPGRVKLLDVHRLFPITPPPRS